MLIQELIILAVAVLLAFVVTRIMIGQMNTAVKQTEAKDYVKSGSFVLTQKSDVFIRENTRKTAKSTEKK